MDGFNEIVLYAGDLGDDRIHENHYNCINRHLYRIYGNREHQSSNNPEIIALKDCSPRCHKLTNYKKYKESLDTFNVYPPNLHLKSNQTAMNHNRICDEEINMSFNEGVAEWKLRKDSKTADTGGRCSVSAPAILTANFNVRNSNGKPSENDQETSPKKFTSHRYNHANISRKKPIAEIHYTNRDKNRGASTQAMDRKKSERQAKATDSEEFEHYYLADQSEDEQIVVGFEGETTGATEANRFYTKSNARPEYVKLGSRRVLTRRRKPSRSDRRSKQNADGIKSWNKKAKQRSPTSRHSNQRVTNEFPCQYHQSSVESCCSIDTRTLKGVRYCARYPKGQLFIDLNESNYNRPTLSPSVGKISNIKAFHNQHLTKENNDGKYHINTANYGFHIKKNPFCKNVGFNHANSRVKISDEELWIQFERLFRSYTTSNRHSGDVISRKISTRWMTQMGVVEDLLRKSDADEVFKSAAGSKIAMNVHEYKEFLINLTMKLKMPFYEIYRRMCGL